RGGYCRLAESETYCSRFRIARLRAAPALLQTPTQCSCGPSRRARDDCCSESEIADRNELESAARILEAVSPACGRADKSPERYSNNRKDGREFRRHPERNSRRQWRVWERQTREW